MDDSIQYFNHVIISVGVTCALLIISAVLGYFKINNDCNIPWPVINAIQGMAVLASFAPLLYEGLPLLFKFVMGI